MRRVKHLFDRVIDFANLYRAFRGASAGKRDRREEREFEYHLESRLWEIRRELEAGSHRWGAYRRFWIHDPKRRAIRAAPFRDRVVHHALVNVLDPIITRGLIRDTYACIRGRGTHLAVRRYRSFARARGATGYVLQCDVQSYFASVDHAVLLALLARRLSDPALLALLRSLITHGAEAPGRGMPIGNLTSQTFANLYLDPLDHFVKETLRVRHYLRYMDDCILLVKRAAEARRCLRDIRDFLDTRLRLRLNPRRTVVAPLDCPRDVLGYVHHRGGRARIRRRSVRRFSWRLRCLEQQIEADPTQWPFARASVASWFGLARRADAYRLSRSILEARDVRNIGKRLLIRSRQALKPHCTCVTGAGGSPADAEALAGSAVGAVCSELWRGRPAGLTASPCSHSGWAMADPMAIAERRQQYAQRLRDAAGELVRRLARLPEVRRISLVGSFARGRADLFTDLDAVVVIDTKESSVERLRRLYGLLGLPVDVDLLCYTPAEFAALRETPFGRHLLKDEVVVYETKPS